MDNYTFINRYFEGQLNEKELKKFKKKLKSDSSFEKKALLVQIEKFLDNELKGGELEKVKKRIENEPDFRKNVEFIMKINNSIKNEKIENFRNLILDIHYEFKTKQKNGTAKKGKIKLLYSKRNNLLIAASIILSISVGSLLLFTMNQTISSLDKIYVQNYNQYEITNYRSNNFVNPNLGFALQAYEEKNYFIAYELFASIKNKSNQIKLYLGFTQIEINHFNEAINTFISIINSDDITLIEHAKWYLGLCYLKTKEKQKAYEQFKDLAEIDESIYNKKAKKIVRQLEYFN